MNNKLLTFDHKHYSLRNGNPYGNINLDRHHERGTAAPTRPGSWWSSNWVRCDGLHSPRNQFWRGKRGDLPGNGHFHHRHYTKETDNFSTKTTHSSTLPGCRYFASGGSPHSRYGHAFRPSHTGRGMDRLCRWGCNICCTISTHPVREHSGWLPGGNGRSQRWYGYHRRGSPNIRQMLAVGICCTIATSLVHLRADSRRGTSYSYRYRRCRARLLFDNFQDWSLQ
jgi:hypothetical protein